MSPDPLLVGGVWGQDYQNVYTPTQKKKQWDTYLSRDANSPLQVGFGDETIKTFAHPLKKKNNQWDTYLSRDANSPL